MKLKQEHRKGIPILVCLILVTLKFLHADNNYTNDDNAAAIKIP